jgi:hypothetical protein
MTNRKTRKPWQKLVHTSGSKCKFIESEGWDSSKANRSAVGQAKTDLKYSW